LTYSPGSLDSLLDGAEMVRGPLLKAAKCLGEKVRTVGYESGPCFEPFSYGAIQLYGESLRRLLCETFPSASLVAADAWLALLRSIKTDGELAQLRVACRVARRAFEQGAATLRADMTEAEAAHAFAGPLSMDGLRETGVSRAGGFVYCMSGANAAQAGAAYARTRARRIQQGDLVLMHCNSYVDGYWTDITRTYSLGCERDRAHELITAVLEARDAALSIIRPGVAASAVDAAARQVLSDRGFGRQFTHGTGHGVGFAAIDHLAHPRLHPASDETLVDGMVFNVEPAIYIEGFGGVRHCDMVAVTATGAEVLTPFQNRYEDLLLAGDSK
jgi:Xaa-Pro dipeptidase